MEISCRTYSVILLSTMLGLCMGQVQGPEKERYGRYWDDLGREELHNSITKFNKLNTNKAKNVILFIGDGMSLATVVAGRMHKAQKQNPRAPGEETLTSLDAMPHLGIMKTYSVDHQTPDSAATATALLCGIKTKSSMLGVSAEANPRFCASIKRNSATSVLENAIAAGKSTGVVTTTRVQHATPAAAYAKSPSRRWYSDAKLSASAKKQGCRDISRQLVDNKGINVILGGGRAHMRPRGKSDEAYSGMAQQGDRGDGKNLIAEWLLGKRRPRYVWNKEEFDAVDPENTDNLMGLFNPFEMNYALDKSSDVAKGEPSLPDMTKKAIQILQKNKDGFFLLVESGLIDKAHHKGLAHYAMEEFVQLEEAVQVAKNLTSDSDTLIIATADHGHVFTIGGGTTVRGNPILGLSPNHRNARKALDGKLFTGATYANGPGAKPRGGRPGVTAGSVANTKHVFQAAIPLPAESHSAEDVPAFSSGPMAHMITGVHEQNYIAHMINYAACMGLYASAIDSHCERVNPEKEKFVPDFDVPMDDDTFNPLPWEDPTV